jgi:hypothetical protein
MKLVLVVLGCAGAVAVASVDSGFGVTSGRSAYVAFRTPSGNIGCGYSNLSGTTAELRCEIVSRLRPLPPKPKTCTEGVWGRAVGMSPTGRARGFCITDTVMDPGAPTLAYGRAWTRGGFTCRSEATGLTCRNRAGHGWTLSRERSRLF